MEAQKVQTKGFLPMKICNIIKLFVILFKFEMM